MKHNENHPNEKILKSKIGLLCDTRWVERHTFFADFSVLYEPLLDALQAITSSAGYDTKAVTEANGLFHQITTSGFISAFVVCQYVLGFTKQLSIKLQSSQIDIAKAYTDIQTVIDVIQDVRDNAEHEFSDLFSDMQRMCDRTVSTMMVPRLALRQMHRNNVPADSPEVYYKRAHFIPFLDTILCELKTRFGNVAKSATRAMFLVPAYLDQLSDAITQDMIEYYAEDMPSRSCFKQELRIWRRFWGGVTDQDRPDTLADTLRQIKKINYPNIYTILSLMLLIPVTSAGVERANSALKFVKTVHRHTMSQDRFNALVLLFVHRDIALDYNKIINMFANRHPRRMLLLDPLMGESS